MWFQLAPCGGAEIASASRAVILQASADPKRVGSLIFIWLPGQRFHGKNGSLWRGGRLLKGRGGCPVPHSRPKAFKWKIVRSAWRRSGLAVSSPSALRWVPTCWTIHAGGRAAFIPLQAPRFLRVRSASTEGRLPPSCPVNRPLPGLLATWSLGGGLGRRPDESTRFQASCSLAVSGADVQDASASS